MLDTRLLTLVFVGLMLLSNGMVWTFFVKALHSQGGSVVATVTSSTTNFLISVYYKFLKIKSLITTMQSVICSLGFSRQLCVWRNYFVALVDRYFPGYYGPSFNRIGQ